MAPFITLCLLLCLSAISSSQGRERDTHIVYLGGVDQSIHPDTVISSHHALLQDILGSPEAVKESLGCSYRYGFSGFSARLSEEQATRISRLPNVLSVFPNEVYTVQTTNSWEFLGLYGSGKNSLFGATEATKTSWLWKNVKYGEDVIIGVLDSGIWPESESFSDDGMGPIPKRWKGTCEIGEQFNSSHCNRKLIGARFFTNGLSDAPKSYARANQEVLSPRDADGHGTHVASTAGGRFVSNASWFGYARGTAKGGAPSSRLAMYKTCWRNIKIGAAQCTDAHILSAFDMGIHDGVDIFSASIGGLGDYFQHATSIGAFHAMQRGIPVVASAGNEQQSLGPGSVQNVAPWILTVGASSIDRDFYADVYLGNNQSFRGLSMTRQTLGKRWYPLVSGANVALASSNSSASQVCLSRSLDPVKVRGTIVACLRGTIHPVLQAGEVLRAGGAGVIICSTTQDGRNDQYGQEVLPLVYFDEKRGRAILSYINSTRSPVADIQHHITRRNVKPAPVMASFSSAGANFIDPDILKPDITAPGVNILAASTEFNNTQTKFITMSGTSMSCPHVTGIVALLKSYHPSWSPAAIKSAIVTTGYSFDNLEEPIKNISLTPATPFDYGGGHINPNAAAHPGLVYDADEQDYIEYLCGLGYNETELMILTQTSSVKCPDNPMELNYPSISISDLRRSKVIHRRVTNVDDEATIYRASVVAPESVSVAVLPPTLEFKRRGETKAFRVIFRVEDDSNMDKDVFGKLIWSNGKYIVISPIVVYPSRS